MFNDKRFFFNFIYLILIIKISLCLKCLEGENFCLKCNTKTDLCDKCINNVLIPDNQGNCIGIQKCIFGENYCNECDKQEKLCQSCDIGLFPDNNGGCSYINNCEISYKGLCLKCLENYILVGESDFKICKSVYSNDFKNCQIINEEKGVCESCESGYFLGKGDFKCTKTENCYKSNFGTCNICIENYYLDRKNDSCLLKENQFINCIESIDGLNCEICDDDYFLSEDYYCIKSNNCAKTNNFNCVECNDNYFLSENGNCSISESCKISEGAIGLCLECSNDFYLDLKDGKCKSNIDDEEYKFCKKYEDTCILCIDNYFLGEDFKCSTSKNCAESENGICIYCSNDYFLGEDSKCIPDHCIQTNNKFECIQCEDNYILTNKTCKIIKDDNLKNCKEANDEGKICILCHDDFYLNQTNNLCYSNKEYGKFYKCKKSSVTTDICEQCISEYYLGYQDKKCTHTVACVYSNEFNQCNRCDDDYFCLNLFNYTCENNEYISYPEKMIFYKCNITNKEGTKCDICKNNYEIGEEGYCYNNIDCELIENGKCAKCKEKNIYNFELCINKYFGCVEISVANCLRCDDPLDTETCTKCYDGYELTEDNHCIPIENN